MIHTQLKEDMKNAMRAKEATRLSVIRGLLSAFTNEAVTKGKKPDEFLTDEEALTVIKRQANQRKDASEQFTTGGRPDLAENEQAELDILTEYLPAQMSVDKIREVALTKKTELGIIDKTKMGLLMGAVMKVVGASADGGDVKKVVEEILN